MNPEKHHTPMTEAILKEMSPEDAFTRLVQGNDRFLSKVKGISSEPKDPRDLREFLITTSSPEGGQFPFAVILSCIDSRMPTETLFDQSIGDVFNTRIAGNFVNQDVLGGMEFACDRENKKGEFIGAKLILVLGHNQCGAIAGATQSAYPGCFKNNYKIESESEEGNLIHMLGNLTTAAKATRFDLPDGKNCKDENWQNEFVDRVAKTNVELTINNIRLQSKVLRDLNNQGKIRIEGAMYDIKSGKVTFSSLDRAIPM